MECCKCEQYNWPDPQPVVWKDTAGDGQEYCVFHAPVEHKGVSAEEFNEKVYARIDAAKLLIDSMAVCLLDGVIFPHNISFTRYNEENPFPPVSFTEATFGDNTNFGGTTFSDNTSFNGAIFGQNVSFYNATFGDNTHFLGATFGDGTRFFDVNFGHRNSFTKSIFKGRTLFTYCTVEGSIGFREIQVDKEIQFNHMSLEGYYFLDFPLTNIKFQNVTWPLSEDKTRYCLPIEVSPYCVALKFEALEDHAFRYAAIADFYRQMKKRCRDEQNDVEASLWHYAEKEVQLKLHRLEKPYSFQRWMLEIYRSISRYGEDPWQALKVFSILMALLALITGIGALSLHAFQPSAVNPERTGKFALTFAQYALLVTPTYTLPPTFAAIALLLSRLLIPIQAAIFAFALRNKLHR